MDEALLSEFASTGCLMVEKFLSGSQSNNLSDWANDVPLVGEVTYEKGQITRCENFVHKHDGFRSLIEGRMASICAELFGETQAAELFKEKLNYKPPGGAGFVPHLDHPSLAYYAPDSFSDFITVMLAIDDMTPLNGCLRVAKGVWNHETAVACAEPQGDPEVGGRAGGIESNELQQLHFEDMICNSGDAFFFNGWVPHRSGSNQSSGLRRAVFFTFNRASQGSYRREYYSELQRIREEWKQRLLGEVQGDYQSDLAAMETIPRKTFDRSLYAASAFVRASLPSDSESDEAAEVEMEALF